MNETTTPAADAPVQVGAIFRASWGYEQTNIDYFEVTAVTAKTVQLRPIGQKAVKATSDMSEYVAPVPGDYTGPAFRRTLARYTRVFVAVDRRHNAYLWDGTPDHQTHWA